MTSMHPPNNDAYENNGEKPEETGFPGGFLTEEVHVGSPESIYANAIEVIDAEVGAITSDGAELEAIPQSLESTREEIELADAEMELTSRLSTINKSVRDVAAGAREKINGVVRQLGKGMEAFTLGVALGAGAYAPPEALPPTVNSEAPLKPEILAYWQDDDSYNQSMAAVFQYSRSLTAHYHGKETPKVIDEQTLSDAIALLERKINEYPQALRKDILTDPNVVDTLLQLNLIAKAEGNEDLSPPELLKAAKAKEKAIRASISGVILLQGDIINSAQEKLERGDSNVVHKITEIFSGHVDNVTELVTNIDEPQQRSSLPGARESVEQIAQEILKKLSPGTEQYRVPQKTALLAFLAKAGNKEGTAILVDKIAKGEVTFNQVPTLFSDQPRRTVSWNTEDDPLGNINIGGEMVATSLLKRYGLSAENYMQYWKTPLENSIYNYRIEENIKKVVALENGKSGSMEKLTKDFGVRFPGRYPIELLREQLDGNSSIPQNFGMVITTREDHNGAFDSTFKIKNLYRQAKQAGSTLRVAEAEDKSEVMARALYMVNQNKGGKAEFVKLGGHGSRDSIAMGTSNKGQVDGTVLGIGRNRTSLILQDGAPVILDSCSTGILGGVAEQLSQHVSGKVIAPDEDAYIKTLNLTRGENGKITTDIEYGNVTNTVSAQTYLAGRKVLKMSTAYRHPN